MLMRRTVRRTLAARRGRAVLAVLLMSGLGPPVRGVDEPAATQVRSRRVELHYRLTGYDRATIELWYTRDRGATWVHAGVDEDGESPMVFEAPAEGPYGFVLVPFQNGHALSAPPEPGDAVHRWVFIDATPPLLQWDAIEPEQTGDHDRVLHLRWTGYDDHLSARPVALAYRSSLEERWRIVDPALPNSGRYDWSMPAGLQGQITLRLSLTDLGGHVVERLHGPVPMEQWFRSAATRPAETVAPAPAAASRPAVEPVSPQRQALARDLYREGTGSLARGEHAVAAERFSEAIEADPTLLPALTDLGSIFYLRQDFAKAESYYKQALARDSSHLPAWRGLHLACIARRQYPQSREALLKMLALQGENAETWLDLGDVTFLLGDPDEARQHWEQAGRLPQADPVVVRKAKQRLEQYTTAALSPLTDAGGSR